MAKKTLKTLVLDIETAPIDGRFWSIWKQNINLDFIVRDWFIMSFSAKWVGQKRVHYMDVSKMDEITDDSLLMVALWELLDEADVVVWHNGDKFDKRKINTRFVIHGMTPPSPYKTVDTLKIAKRHFAFTSNKLLYLTRILCKSQKLTHQEFSGAMLWEECLNGNKKAWREMKKYNKMDVVSLEELYLIFRSWDDRHPNIGVYTDKNEFQCRCCGSTNIQRRGYYYTRTGKYQKYVCNDCGTWSRERYTCVPKQKGKSLLTNVSM